MKCEKNIPSEIIIFYKLISRRPSKAAGRKLTKFTYFNFLLDSFKRIVQEYRNDSSYCEHASDD